MVTVGRKVRVPTVPVTTIAFLRLLVKSINYWKDHGLNLIFFVTFSSSLFNPSEIFCSGSFNYNFSVKEMFVCRRKPPDRVQRF